MDRMPPLGVVVLPIQRIVPHPGAPSPAILPKDRIRGRHCLGARTLGGRREGRPELPLRLL